MRSVKVKWCDDDLKLQISALGFEPTAKNVKALKDSRLRKNMEEAMLMAGWDAMNETIVNVLSE